MPVGFGRSRILIPATVGITVGGLFLALWGVVNDRTRTEVRIRSTLTAAQVTDRLKKEVGFCIRLLHGFQAEWDSGLIPSQTVFAQRASALRTYFPSIAAIEVLNEANSIMWREPDRHGTVWLAPALATRPRPRTDSAQSADQDALLISPALQFGNETVGVAAFLPVHGGGASSLRVSLIVTGLIKDSLLGSGHGDFAYVVYDEGRRIYPAAPSGTLLSQTYSYSHPLVLANRTWVVGVAPLPTSMEAMLNLGTNLVLAIGIVVAGCMTFVSARLLSSQQRLRDNEERLRAITEHIPGVVYSYETAPGKPRTLIYLGPNLDSLIGPLNAARVSERFDTLFELVHPEDRQRVSETAADGSATGGLVDCEARLLTDDGSYRWIRSLSRPTPIDHGRTRWHMVLIDLTEHRRTIDALRESEERYRVLVESSPVGVLIHRDSVFLFVNPAALRLLGYERAEELVDREIFEIIPVGAHDVVKQRLAQTGQEQEPLRFTNERLVRRDGTEIDVEIIASNINYGGSTARQTLVLDTTEQRQAERRQRLLMQELDHRVKNNLAAVLALLDQTAASTNDFGIFRVKFSNRIKAMARTHEILAASGWSGAELSDIMRLSVTPHVVDESDRVRFVGTSVVVSPRSALPLGLAFHELATNALKHGSLSVPNGRVEIRSTPEDDCIVLRWTESGGPPAREPEVLGTGLRLVRGLVEFELGGAAAFEFGPQGLVCTVRIEAAVLTERS